VINLRYHIVSITAVFLALGIGLVFGAAFIDRATVEALDRNLNAIERQNEDLQQENAGLERQVGAADAAEQELREQGLAQLVAGHLEGVPVLVLAVEGVDAEAVRATADAAVAAGAQLGGVLWFTERLVLDDEGEVADLADVLQLGIDDPARLRSSMARRLGTVFEAAAEPAAVVDPAATTTTTVDATTTTVPPDGEVVLVEPPLIAALRAAEFLELDPPAQPAPFAVVPESGLRVVMVSGPGAVLPDADLVVPMLDRLTEDVIPQSGGPVVVAAQRGPDDDAQASEGFDPAVERVAFVGQVRTSESLRDRVSTVDDIERFTGLVAVVLALEHGSVGQFGHYGVGEGAQSLLPPQPSPDGG
jgi:hypothetical protein